jgi:hypothetical protein
MPNQSQYRPAIRLSARGDFGCELVTERAINRIVLERAKGFDPRPNLRKIAVRSRQLHRSPPVRKKPADGLTGLHRVKIIDAQFHLCSPQATRRRRDARPNIRDGCKSLRHPRSCPRHGSADVLPRAEARSFWP